MNEYSTLYGLGQKTGIEVGESTGVLAGPSTGNLGTGLEPRRYLLRRNRPVGQRLHPHPARRLLYDHRQQRRAV